MLKNKIEKLKFSVITVCYNSEKTIEKAIKSVISQKNVEIEYIIVDGKSQDKTLQIIDKYRNKIAQILSESDKGIFDAMNKGIGIATGDIISFLNSDDWYEPNALCEVEQAFLVSQADIVVGNSYYISSTGEIIYYDGDVHGENDIHIRMPYHHESIFAKKKLFKNTNNFNLSYKLAADYDWFLRQFLCGVSIYRINLPVFSFVYGGVSSVNAIECAYETKVIAASYTSDPGILARIERRWIDVIAANIDNPEIEKVMGGDISKYKENVYVWGTGKWAEKTVQLIEREHIGVAAYVDENRNKQKKRFYGYKVIGFEEIPVDSVILIATPKYENEIRELLIQKNWDMENVYSIKDLNRIAVLRVARSWEKFRRS